MRQILQSDGFLYAVWRLSTARHAPHCAVVAPLFDVQRVFQPERRHTEIRHGCTIRPKNRVEKYHSSQNRVEKIPFIPKIAPDENLYHIWQIFVHTLSQNLLIFAASKKILITCLFVPKNFYKQFTTICFQLTESVIQFRKYSDGKQRVTTTWTYG